MMEALELRMLDESLHEHRQAFLNFAVCAEDVYKRQTPNIPSNVLEESQIAGNLDGIVSQETQLGVLDVYKRQEWH